MNCGGPQRRSRRRDAALSRRVGMFRDEASLARKRTMLPRRPLMSAGGLLAVRLARADTDAVEIRIHSERERSKQCSPSPLSPCRR
jgi:hypothetical protein